MNIAVYPGSFRPFTNGHLHVVKEASRIFDRVFVAISVNRQKIKIYDTDRMRTAIRECLKREQLENVFVEYSYGMTGDFCISKGAKFIVRGIRNPQDYCYEESIAKTNKALYHEIETVYIRAKDEIVSSSMVRDLAAFRRDVSEYVPQEVLPVIGADYV